MNIADILHRQALTQPETIAIIDTYRGHSRKTTFAELELSASRAATRFKQVGLQPGDAVLFFQPMSAELYVALMAVFRLGMVAMFLDPSAGRKHIERCCALYTPKALIASSKAHLLRFVSPALCQIPIKFAIGLPVPGAIAWNCIQRSHPQTSIHPCTSDTPALLTFTSGSTGQPKAAVRSPGFLLAQHRVLDKSLKLIPGEVDLTTLPIFVLANLASGVTSLIPNTDLRFPGRINAAALMAQIRAHQPTSTAASPALLQCLVDHCQRQGLQLPSLQRIFTGGAPVFPRLLDHLQKLAPHATVTAVYGSTEAEPIAHMPRHEMHPDDLDMMLGGKGLLVGPPVAEIQLRILQNQWGKPIGPYNHAEFTAACLPHGEVGEIVVGGDHVLPGYLGGQGDTETKFKVNDLIWHRTGDAGYLDHQGRLWLLGRCSAQIQDQHGILYPFTVECAANQYPEIRRAAVVSQGGRRVLAIELKQGESKQLEILKEFFAWAEIAEVRILKTIPVDQRHNAKVDYPALEKLIDTGNRLAG